MGIDGGVAVGVGGGGWGAVGRDPYWGDDVRFAAPEDGPGSNAEVGRPYGGPCLCAWEPA